MNVSRWKPWEIGSDLVALSPNRESIATSRLRLATPLRRKFSLATGAGPCGTMTGSIQRTAESTHLLTRHLRRTVSSPPE